MPPIPTRTPPEREHLDILGATLTITADGDDTDGQFTVLEMLVPPGFENGLHSHEPAEIFHVTEGEMLLHAEGEASILGRGSSAYVAGDDKHGFRPVGDEALRILAVLAPAGIERFFRAVGTPLDEQVLPESDVVTEADLDDFFATGEEHGIGFFGPLPAVE